MGIGAAKLGGAVVEAIARCGQRGVGTGAIRAREAALEGDGTGDRIKRIDSPFVIGAAIEGGAVVDAIARCGQRGVGSGTIRAREEGLKGDGIRNRAGNRDINGINQPAAPLSQRSRQIRRPA